MCGERVGVKIASDYLTTPIEVWSVERCMIGSGLIDIFDAIQALCASRAVDFAKECEGMRMSLKIL